MNKNTERSKRPKKYFCEHCQAGFTRKDNLSRHQRDDCKLMKSNNEKAKVLLLKKQLAEKEKEIAKLKNIPLPVEALNRFEKMEKEIAQNNKEIAELKENPRISNQILQVVCVGTSDNYLDMLTDEWNNFDRALEYIKDCALSSLAGDCKLIEKMYLGERNANDEPSIRFLDKGKTRIEYFNEKKEKISDSKEMFGKKIANNLQNSYLKGINYLLTQNLENHRCPNKFLEEYDLQIWNQHIYDLSDLRYHRKIINQLNIPNF